MADARGPTSVRVLASKLAALVMFSCLISGAGAARNNAPASDARPLFVTSLPILRSVCTAVAGTRADCASILPPGTSPQSYEPTSADKEKIVQATALFYAAPRLDGWAAPLKAREKHRMIDWVPRAMRIPQDSPSAEADPYFWLDPLAAVEVVSDVTRVMCNHDKTGCPDYKAGGAALVKELRQVHAEVSRQLAAVKDRPVSAPSFLSYMVQRYGLKAAERGNTKSLDLDALGATAGRDTLPALIRYNATVISGL
jgi:zinc transport system substrate-binding protein